MPRLHNSFYSDKLCGKTVPFRINERQYSPHLAGKRTEVLGSQVAEDHAAGGSRAGVQPQECLLPNPTCSTAWSPAQEAPDCLSALKLTWAAPREGLGTCTCVDGSSPRLQPRTAARTLGGQVSFFLGSSAHYPPPPSGAELCESLGPTQAPPPVT